MNARALAAITLLLAPTAFAAAPKAKKKRKPAPTPAQIAHPFDDVPVAKLHVVNTRNSEAIVENKTGDVVLVRAGDTLGAERFQVVKIALGCCFLKGTELKGSDTDLTLCADVPEVPRT